MDCSALDMLPAVEALVKKWWDDDHLVARDLTRLRALQARWNGLSCGNCTDAACPYATRGEDWLTANGYRYLYDFLAQPDFQKLSGRRFPVFVADINERSRRLPGAGFSKQ